jgi:hypothetical protein
MAEEKDDTIADVIEGDQSASGKSEESDKQDLSLEKVAQIAKATQKGYTSTRQEIAQLKEAMQEIVDSITSQKDSGGNSPYVTEQRLKEIFVEIQSQQESLKQQANDYIENTLEDLRSNGVIEKGEEESLMQFAVKIKESDLSKAATIWKEIKYSKEEGKKEAAKKVERQEAGSKVGTSSKTGTSEQIGVDYKKMKRFDWFGGNL